MFYNIMKKRSLWLTIASSMTVISIILFAMWGLKLGIDFTGGSLMEIKFLETRPAVTEISEIMALAKLNSENIVQPVGETNMIIRFQETDEAAHQRLSSELRKKYDKNVQEERFESVGPSMGKELKTKAFYAIVIALIAIISYIAWAFRKVSWPVPSWKYGAFAILALVHDIMIPIGVFAVLGKFMNVEIGLSFIAALLTILGYSVNDTIVVFDRVRENLGRLTKIDFESLVSRSIMETLARSINSTMTTLLVLFAIALFGGESVRFFAIALLVGIACGAYSSIFIACPLLVYSEPEGKK